MIDPASPIVTQMMLSLQRIMEGEPGNPWTLLEGLDPGEAQETPQEAQETPRVPTPPERLTRLLFLAMLAPDDFCADLALEAANLLIEDQGISTLDIEVCKIEATAHATPQVTIDAAHALSPGWN